jgi:2-polyprenyl-3-methyl-5-hydroxy-6-metoxy-1,4-benzoquinol methylase
MIKHEFTEILFDTVPEKYWRKGFFQPDTKLGFCDTCGFYHLDPYPDAEILKRFYTDYEMPTPQANLGETARLLASNLAHKNAKILDAGCGNGEFLLEMSKLGYTNLVGFDQSPGIERAKNLGIGEFYNKSIWEELDELENGKQMDYDAVVMVNVLEHVVEPVELLKRLYGLMKTGAQLCVTVPNDFSKLQRAYLKSSGNDPWFVILPDHVNYFDFDSFRHAISSAGFEVLDEMGLYPLEMFLLQDLDYISNPDLGPIAHQRRVDFEERIKNAGMTDILDHFYRTLATGGYGRDTMVVARKA